MNVALLDPVVLLVIGAALIAGGSAALTWLIVDHTAVARWRERAQAAEELLARQRAQARQRRQPHDDDTDVIIPGLFDEADRALEAEAPTVLMRALTPEARQMHRQLQARHRGLR